jgi:hypothetical protein
MPNRIRKACTRQGGQSFKQQKIHASLCNNDRAKCVYNEHIKSRLLQWAIGLVKPKQVNRATARAKLHKQWRPGRNTKFYHIPVLFTFSVLFHPSLQFFHTFTPHSRSPSRFAQGHNQTELHSRKVNKKKVTFRERKLLT